MWLKIPIDTFDPEGRGLFISLTVHCEARIDIRRLILRSLSPIVAMALATLATSQPYRLGDFSYVTIKI